MIEVGSDWYQRPFEFAKSIFAFYECGSCSRPFFGGRRDCEEEMRQAQACGVVLTGVLRDVCGSEAYDLVENYRYISFLILLTCVRRLVATKRKTTM